MRHQQSDAGRQLVGTDDRLLGIAHGIDRVLVVDPSPLVPNDDSPATR